MCLLTCLLLLAALADFGAREDQIIPLSDDKVTQRPDLSTPVTIDPRMRALLRRVSSITDSRHVSERRHLHCICCCCDGNFVNNATFLNRRSAELSAELERRGILGCDSEELRRAVASARPLRGGVDGGVKKRGAGLLREVEVQGRRAVVVPCTECHRLGIGTLIAKRHSPFIVDLIGYCPPSTDEGYFVLERMTHATAVHTGLASQLEGISASERLAAILHVIGAVRELHSLGRLVADFGSHQFMLDDKKRVKLVDVDCAFERNSLSMAGDIKCLGASKEADINAWVRVESVERLNRRRDATLVAAVVCRLLDSATLSLQQREQVQRLYRSALDVNNEQLDLGAVMQVVLRVMQISDSDE